MSNEELIDNPVKGIEKCNEHVRKLEQMIQEARDKDDLDTASRCEGHLVKWMELLEHLIRQKYQQGYDSEDITQSLKGKKKRFNS